MKWKHALCWMSSFREHLCHGPGGTWSWKPHLLLWEIFMKHPKTGNTEKFWVQSNTELFLEITRPESSAFWARTHNSYWVRRITWKCLTTGPADNHFQEPTPKKWLYLPQEHPKIDHTSNWKIYKAVGSLHLSAYMGPRRTTIQNDPPLGSSLEAMWSAGMSPES